LSALLVYPIILLNARQSHRIEALVCEAISLGFAVMPAV
jgi:hypothetical protein